MTDDNGDLRVENLDPNVKYRISLSKTVYVIVSFEILLIGGIRTIPIIMAKSLSPKEEIII